MKLRFALVVACGIGVCAVASPCLADDSEAVVVEVPANLAALTDEEVSERLRFAEEKLDYRRRYAQAWQYGWTSFYGLGIAVQSYQAATTESAGKQADYIASAIKAVGGVADKLIRPLRARKGAEPLREMPDATREDRVRRLAVAEEYLRTDAEQADRRFSILRHVGVVGVNSVAAVIVSQAFETDDDRAWTSAGVGIVVGEIMIWTQPWWPRGHLEEYESRFGGQKVSWQIVPTLGGATFEATF
jgi:hypothetical protein